MFSWLRPDRIRAPWARSPLAVAVACLLDRLIGDRRAGCTVQVIGWLDAVLLQRPRTGQVISLWRLTARRWP